MPVAHAQTLTEIKTRHKDGFLKYLGQATGIEPATAGITIKELQADIVIVQFENVTIGRVKCYSGLVLGGAI